jgi:hypothetical protein
MGTATVLTTVLFEEHHSSDQIKKNEMGVSFSMHVLVRKPEGTVLFGRPRGKGECNIKMDLKEIRRVCTGFTLLSLFKDTASNSKLLSVKGLEYSR